MKRFLMTAGLTAVTLAHAGAAFAARPLIPVLDAAALSKICDSTLARAKATVKGMESRKGGATLFDEWNRLQIDVENMAGPVYLLGNVSPDKKVRDASEPCQQALTTFNTQIFQSEQLYQRVVASKPVTPQQVMLKKDLVEGFEDTGVALPPAKRARMKEILDRLELLKQQYDKNVRDDPTKVTFTPAEMAGMPEAYIKAQKKDDKGNFVLDLKSPAYVPFVTNATNAEARKRYYIAKNKEGGKENLTLLDEAMNLRYEMAGLYGMKSFAEYTLQRRMAATPANVEKFLAEVRGAITEAEKAEVAELTALKAKDIGKPVAETKLERWDSTFYAERMRQARYAIDQEALRKYFPSQNAVDFALKVSSRLYGVTFKQVKVPVWNDDVLYYDVLDAATGKFISGMYLDLYPRDGKYGHAAAFPVFGVSTKVRRTPVSVLVTNLDRKGLNHDELETLFHEFGHVLHGVLSKAVYNPHSGTSVKRDFVEAPSQMFEEWVRREPTLSLMKEVCAQCPQLTSDEIKRLDEARRYGRAMRYTRQWNLALFDMALVSGKPPGSLDAWKAIEEKSLLGHVEGTMLPASFGHLMGGYAAGYYGYMWSEVIALDMLSAFGNNLMDAKVGKRYRDTILAQGGQIEPQDMVKNFLGREPNSKAFFAELVGKRN
jgi:thimet oligopeptidase